MPVREVWYQVLVYSANRASDVIDAFVKWQNEGGASDVKSTIGLAMGIDFITVLLVYGGPQEQPSAFQPFYELQPTQVPVPGTIGSFTSLTNVFASVTSSKPMR